MSIIYLFKYFYILMSNKCLHVPKYIKICKNIHYIFFLYVGFPIYQNVVVFIINIVYFK